MFQFLRQRIAYRCFELVQPELKLGFPQAQAPVVIIDKATGSRNFEQRLQTPSSRYEASNPIQLDKYIDVSLQMVFSLGL